MATSVPTGDDDRVANLLRELGVSRDFRISESFVSEVLGLIGDQPDLLDLKIASAAVTEMRDAFEVFKPYREVRKVTIFGSARTKPDDPLYDAVAADQADPDILARLASVIARGGHVPAEFKRQA